MIKTADLMHHLIRYFYSEPISSTHHIHFFATKYSPPFLLFALTSSGPEPTIPRSVPTPLTASATIISYLSD